jgi:hypothetical protein
VVNGYRSVGDRAGCLWPPDFAFERWHEGDGSLVSLQWIKHHHSSGIGDHLWEYGDVVNGYRSVGDRAECLSPPDFAFERWHEGDGGLASLQWIKLHHSSGISDHLGKYGDVVNGHRSLSDSAECLLPPDFAFERWHEGDGGLATNEWFWCNYSIGIGDHLWEYGDVVNGYRSVGDRADCRIPRDFAFER